MLCLFRSMILASILCFSVGCGGDGRPDLVPVTGTIKLDGEPLAKAQVVFIMTEGVEDFGRPLTAMTNDSGQFTLSTYSIGDGAPVGKYQVTVTKKELIGELPEGYNSEVSEQYDLKYKWITPQKYSIPGESGLTAEVTGDGLEPAVLDLSTDGEAPFIESTGGGANEP